MLRSSGISQKSAALIVRYSQKKECISIVLRVLQLLITLEPLHRFRWGFQQNVPLQMSTYQIENWKCHMCEFQQISLVASHIVRKRNLINNRQISTSKSLFLVSGTYCIIIHIHSQDGTSAGNYCWEEQWVFHIIIWLRLSVNFPTSTHLPLLKHSCQTFLFFKHFVFSAGCCWATLWPKYHVIMCTMINMHAKNKMPKIKYVSLNFIKLQEWMWHHYMISKAINHNYKNDNKIQVHKKVACIFKMLYATSIP